MGVRGQPHQPGQEIVTHGLGKPVSNYSIRKPDSKVKLKRKLDEARITRALRKAKLRSSEFQRLRFFSDQTHRFEYRIHMVPDIEKL